MTGRTYVRTRPRGFAAWSPSAETAQLLDTVGGVFEDYRGHLPLTVRQVFYRLVGTTGYEKTERAYKRLGDHLVRARRAGLVPWEYLRDDGPTVAEPDGWEGPGQFWRSVRHLAEGYDALPERGQAQAVEVWVEAAGMVPQVRRVAAPLGASVLTAGGFDSVTWKHEAARRLAERFDAEGRPTVILHIGDLDPSGCSVIDSAAEDVLAFLAGFDARQVARFERVAVTPEQVTALRLPAAPQKTTDRRGAFMASTVQAEAIDPATLAAIVTAAVEAEIDLARLAEERDRGEAERRVILADLERLGFGEAAP